MIKLTQALKIAKFNFSTWPRNPRIYVSFALAFILCFLLTEKTLKLAADQGTTLQLVETFVWTFGDSNSILLASLLLTLLFADMPFLSAATPFYLLRCDRKTWLLGQLIYLFAATTLFMAFILFSTVVLSMHNAFPGNLWSETAAILGYSGAGSALFLPASIRAMEMSTPYACMGNIFLLMLLYTALQVSIMLTANLKKGQLAGILAVLIFGLYGFLLNPRTIQAVLALPEEMLYRANVIVGWLSPLNHATYHMHTFGFDALPTIWQTILIFVVLIALFSFLSLRAIRRYNYIFSGTEE